MDVKPSELDLARMEWMEASRGQADMKTTLEKQKNYIAADLKARGIVTGDTFAEFIKGVRERRCPGFTGEFDVVG